MSISATGLAAQRLRMNVLSSNLANAQTTRTPEGGPYKRQDVVFSANPSGNTFAEMMSDPNSEQIKKSQLLEYTKTKNLLKKFLILTIKMPMKKDLLKCQISK